MKKLIWASGLLLLLTVTACQNKHKQGSGNLEHKTLTDSSIVKIDKSVKERKGLK